MTPFQRVLAQVRLDVALQAVEDAKNATDTQALNKAYAEARAARHAIMGAK